MLEKPYTWVLSPSTFEPNSEMVLLVGQTDLLSWNPVNDNKTKAATTTKTNLFVEESIIVCPWYV